eukprot:m.644462 g.644462  ORF g.644462 m.644462 type:complete len:171 (+) comp58352_c0_seq20:992-1504(+)
MRAGLFWVISFVVLSLFIGSNTTEVRARITECLRLLDGVQVAESLDRHGHAFLLDVVAFSRSWNHRRRRRRQIGGLDGAELLVEPTAASAPISSASTSEQAAPSVSASTEPRAALSQVESERVPSPILRVQATGTEQVDGSVAIILRIHDCGTKALLHELFLFLKNELVC